jgi:hypothetical protein
MHAQVLSTIDGVAATDDPLYADRRNFYKVEKWSKQIGCTSRRHLLMQSAWNSPILIKEVENDEDDGYRTN